MIYPIVKFGDPVLEKVTQPITEFDTPELNQLLADMFESMYEAHGVGLAAPQIGISKRIAVIDVTFKEDPSAKLVLINPEIINPEGKISDTEGCLSIPEFRAYVERPSRLVLRGLDRAGQRFEIEASKLFARILQHETDHLNGLLFVDRLTPAKRDAVLRKLDKAFLTSK